MGIAEKIKSVTERCWVSLSKERVCVGGDGCY
jgi:hypothetical protein